MELFKKINYRIVSIILAGVLMIGAIGVTILLTKPVYTPAFVVTGDVEQTLKIESMAGFDKCTVVRDGKRYTSVMLEDLITQAVPYAEDNTVVIKGDDGLIAAVDGNKLEGMHIVNTAEYGWEMINEYHPPSSNIKRITQIWVVADEEVREHAVNIITADTNIASYTPGQLFMSETSFAPMFHGQSETTGKNGSYKVAVYTEQRYKDVTDFAPDANDVLVMGEEGQYAYDVSPGKISFVGNELYYVFSDGKTTMKDVRGVLIDPPSASNMDAYHEAINNIDSGERVMVILIDGFGYHQYVHATENGYAPCLASMPPAKQASTVYKPVTYPGLAAMLTGQPPCVNGVFQRGMSDLNAPDIFTYIANIEKTSEYIEGNVNILNTSIKPILNADKDGDGSTDNEVFESAKSAVIYDADYIFIHFHGVDDYGHDYGDMSQQTINKLSEVDAYVGELIENFDGRVIISADHGMHETQDGGSHGVFCCQDMIVPYITYKK